MKTSNAFCFIFCDKHDSSVYGFTLPKDAQRDENGPDAKKDAHASLSHSSGIEIQTPA